MVIFNWRHGSERVNEIKHLLLFLFVSCRLLKFISKWQRYVSRLFQFVSKSLILMTDIFSHLWLIKLDTKVRFWAHSFTHTVLQFQMFCKQNTILICLSFKRGSFSLSGQLSCCSVSCDFCVALLVYFRNTECVCGIFRCLLLWCC